MSIIFDVIFNTTHDQIVDNFCERVAATRHDFLYVLILSSCVLACFIDISATYRTVRTLYGVKDLKVTLV